MNYKNTQLNKLWKIMHKQNKMFNNIIETIIEKTLREILEFKNKKNELKNSMNFQKQIQLHRRKNQ